MNILDSPPKNISTPQRWGRRALLCGALLLTLGTPAQAKTIIGELSPVLNGACSFSSEELLTKVLGDVKFVCDLRDMVNSLEPLLESGSYEQVGLQIANRLGANLVADKGIAKAIGEANDAFAKAKTNLSGSLQDFYSLGERISKEAVKEHKSGAQLKKAGQELVKTDAEGQAMLDHNAGVIGNIITTQTTNMGRLARSTSAATSSDKAAGSAVKRSLDTVNPIGGVASKLGGELRASLSTRDTVETLGKIQLEQLKLQSVSDAGMAQQLSAMTQQSAVTNELLIEQYNSAVVERLDAIQKAESDYNDYAEFVASIKNRLVNNVDPALKTLEDMGIVNGP